MVFTAAYFAAAGAVAWLVIRSLFPRAAFPDRLTAGLVLAQTAVLIPVQVAAGVELAGISERVQAWQLALGELALLIAAFIFFKRRSIPERAASNPLAIPLYFKLAGLAIAGAYLIGAVNGLSSYIRNYDAISYHLLLPLHWMLDGTLLISPDTNWQLGLPANAEMTMLVLLFSGNESLLILAQWTPLVCIASSVYNLALSLSRSRLAGLCCAAVLLTSPILYFQAFCAYVDLFAAAFLLAAVALGERALRAGDEESPAAWAGIAGLACGIAIGSKTLYLAYAAIFTVLFLVLLWLGKTQGKFLRIAGTTLLGMAIPSMFWYLRGAVFARNPLFPMELKIGDFVVFAGTPAVEINPNGWAIGRWIKSETDWLTYPWFESRTFPSMTGYSIDSGLGGAFAAFVPLGLAFLVWTAWRRRTDRQLWFWLLAWAGCGLIWWFPSHQTLRFGLVFFVLSIVLSAPLFAVLNETRSRVFQWAFCGSIGITCAILALEPASFIASRVIFNLETRAEVHDYPKAIDELPDGSTVLNLAAPLNFLMAGERLTNRVVAHFEKPEPLTSEFLRSKRVDFIVGRGDQSEMVAGLPEVRLYRSEVVTNPISKTDWLWLIWIVDKPVD